MSPGEHRAVAFKLSAATECWIDIVDPQGQPIQGAQIAVINFVDVNKSDVYTTYATAHAMDYQFAVSDNHGRLKLPPLPEHANASITVIHPDWQLGHLSKQEVTPGLLTHMSLKSGVKVVCNFAARPGQLPLADGEVIHVAMFASERRRDDPKDVRFGFPVHNGAISFAASPVEFDNLRLTCSSHFIAVPIVNRADSPDSRLCLQNAETGAVATFDFTTLARMKARGRVIDSQGRGVPSVSVSSSVAAIETAAYPSEVDVKDRAQYGREWVGAGDADTDSNGNFEIELSPGKATIELIADGYFSDPTIYEFAVPSGHTDFQLPHYILHAVPKLNGRVVSAEGLPVGDAYVRLRHSGYGDADPVGITDAEGNFTLTLSRIPFSASWGLQTEAAVMALDAASDTAGLSTVNLKDAAACDKIVIQLAKQEPGG